MIKVVIGLLALFLVYFIWQKWELTQFRVSRFQLSSEKIKNPLKLVLIADLHGHVYGRDNDSLVRAIQKENPDLILIAGDLIVEKYEDTYDISLSFLKQINGIAPIYFCNGNHESRVRIGKKTYQNAFFRYEKAMQELGIHFVNNCSEEMILKGNHLAITGIEIPMKCYKKGKRVPLPEGYMDETLGKRSAKENYEILLAHNPAYAKSYFAYGSDLTLSGHTHGGLVRIPGIGSVFSPQFEFFPKYDAGLFEEDGKNLLISKGLGTHTFHIRVFDRAELVTIQLEGK